MEAEIVLSVEQFDKMVQQIKDLQAANDALNEMIRKYNKYAKENNVKETK